MINYFFFHKHFPLAHFLSDKRSIPDIIHAESVKQFFEVNRIREGEKEIEKTPKRRMSTTK